MAYFNNLTVGGTTRFLQDVKWPGLKSTVDELNYLHKEVVEKEGYYLSEVGDGVVNNFIYFTSKKAGLIAGNTYTVTYNFIEDDPFVEQIVAADISADTGIAGSVMLVSEEFGDLVLYDNVHMNADGEPVAGGSMQGSLSYWDCESIKIEGTGTNGVLTSTTVEYNKIPKEHLPDEILSKVEPIVTEIKFDDVEYPYPVDAFFFNSYSNDTFNGFPLENQGYVWQAKDIDTTNKTFNIYATSWRDGTTEIKIGTITSTSDWCPTGDEYEIIGFYKDSSNKYWARVLPLFPYAIPGFGTFDTSVVWKPIRKPGVDYNKCTIEFNQVRPFLGDVINEGFNFDEDALPFNFTMNPTEILTPFFGQLSNANSHNEEIWGNFTSPSITLSDDPFYSCVTSGKAEIHISKNSVDILGHCGVVPIPSYIWTGSPGEPSHSTFCGHAFRNSFKKESDSNIYEDLRTAPLYGVCWLPMATLGSWWKITWEKE